MRMLITRWESSGYRNIVFAGLRVLELNWKGTHNSWKRKRVK